MDISIPNEMNPVIVGAALAVAGGLLTQALFLWSSRCHTKKVLLIALKAELKLLREQIGSSITGICKASNNDERPKLDVFSLATPVFDANAEHLGNIQDPDLVEQIVEVYGTVYEIREKSRLFSNLPNESSNDRFVAEILLSSIPLHVQAVKLHGRLVKVIGSIEAPLTKDEVEINRLFKIMQDLHKKGEIDELLETTWWGVLNE